MLTWGFIAEFVVKHAGLGYVRYWTDPWNVLDGIIVLLSITEMVLVLALSGQSPAGLQALRTFRVLRILRSLRLLAQVPALRRLMKLIIKVRERRWWAGRGGDRDAGHLCTCLSCTALQAFVALKDFFLLLGLFIYIFAILVRWSCGRGLARTLAERGLGCPVRAALSGAVPHQTQESLR